MTATKTSPAEKRYAAISSLCESVRSVEITETGPVVTWNCEDPARVADLIRTGLAHQGRTERWTGAVEAWAVAVETSTPETFRWAFDQYGIWASYAAE